MVHETFQGAAPLSCMSSVTPQTPRAPYIAHLSSAHSRSDVRVFRKMCVSIAAAGWRCGLVVADGKGPETTCGVEVLDAGASLGRLDRILRAPARIRELAVALDADCYHLHDPELLPIGMQLRKLGKCVIFDSHEDVPRHMLAKRYAGPTLRRGLSLALRAYMGHACQRIDGIIAATDHIGSTFAGVAKDIAVVRNFPLLEEFADVTHVSGRHPTVCYVGGISRERGLREMCTAVAASRHGVRLRLCGSFSNSVLEAATKAMPEWKHVDYRGAVDRPGIREAFRESIAGLVVLQPIDVYTTSLPVKMFEYMSAGLPVIASDFPLWRTVIRDHQCGILVNPSDPNSITEAIDRLVNAPDEARMMGERGRAAVKARFNWAIEESVLLSFYRRLLGRRDTLTG